MPESSNALAAAMIDAIFMIVLPMMVFVLLGASLTRSAFRLIPDRDDVVVLAVHTVH